MLRYLSFGVLFLAASQAYGQLYKCDHPDGTKTYTNKVLDPPIKCADLMVLRAQREEESNRRYSEAMAALGRDAALFRKGLKIGDRTNLGLVIEIKRPIAKIQARDGETWFRIEDLAPIDYHQRSKDLWDKTLPADRNPPRKANP